MSGAAKPYVRGVHQQFEMYAAWPPFERRERGDIGVFVDGEFQRIGSLKQQGGAFKPVKGSVSALRRWCLARRP